MDLTGLGGAFDFAKGLLDRFWPEQASEEDKLAALKQMAPMLEQREQAIVEAKKSVLVAEMQQGDTYTKRARPTIVYAGLALIFLNWAVEAGLKIVSALQIDALDPAQIETLRSVTEISLPGEFWAAWSGVVGIYAIGRSAEKRGVTGKIVSMITGNK